MDTNTIRDNWLKMPKIHENAHVDDSAEICGDVTISQEVMISPHVSIRADEGTPFFIGKGTNIQDSVTFHGLYEQYILVNEEKFSIYVGSHVSIAHNAIIHGPSLIEKKCFIGFRATIHDSKLHRNCYIDMTAVVNNSIVGANSYIGIGAIVSGVKISPNRYIADGQIVNTQAIADLLPEVTVEHHEKLNAFNKKVVDFNKMLLNSKLHHKEVAHEK